MQARTAGEGDPRPARAGRCRPRSATRAALEREAQRRARFIVGTNVLDNEAGPTRRSSRVRTHPQVERGFAFLKDPLFLASSVFVKKPERIMALALVMVLCLLVYKLAEVRLRQRVGSDRADGPRSGGKPTARPTMRWLFQCFEGIDLHHTRHPEGRARPRSCVSPCVHRLVLHLLGPAYENAYLVFTEPRK